MIYKDDCTLPEGDASRPKEYLEQLTAEGLESLPEIIQYRSLGVLFLEDMLLFPG
jgi:hypothetical protein